MNIDTISLERAVSTAVQRYLIEHPLPTEEPIRFEVVASNTIVIVRSSEQGKSDTRTIDAILSRHRAIGWRLRHACDDKSPKISIYEFFQITYSDLLKYRNIGHIRLARLAEDFKKEGFIFPWIEDAIANDPKNIRDGRSFPSGEVKALSKADWEKIHLYVEQINSVTVKVRRRVLKQLEIRENAPTLLRNLFVPSLSSGWYLTYISIINKRWEYLKLPYRIRITPISKVCKPHEAHAQIVMV